MQWQKAKKLEALMQKLKQERESDEHYVSPEEMKLIYQKYHEVCDDRSDKRD